MLCTTYHRLNYMLWKKNREGKLNISLESCFVCSRAAKISLSQRQNLSREWKDEWKTQDTRDKRGSETNRYFIRGKFAAACRSQHFPHTYVCILSRHVHSHAIAVKCICVCMYACKHTYYR